MNRIREMMRDLCKPNGVCSCLSVCFGGNEESVCEYLGTIGDGIPVDSETIFDLASVTKLFLAIVYQKMVEENLVCLDEPIERYTIRFQNIANIKLKHLLSFNVQLQTDKRIDECNSRDEAIIELCDIKGNYSEKPIYSDMAALVLGELIYDISGKNFGDWIDDLFVGPYNLKATLWRKLPKDYSRICSYDNEKWLINGVLYNKNNPVAEVNDPKSRVLGNHSEFLCGNAGLFSSINDLEVLSKALLNGSIISKKSLMAIAEGGGWENRGDQQSFGFQCYRKDVNPIQTEVPSKASKYAIASVGFTGLYWLLDIENNCYIIIVANKLKDCVSKVYPNIAIEESRILFDGKQYDCSVNYVYQRDRLRDYIYDLLIV